MGFCYNNAESAKLISYCIGFVLVCDFSIDVHCTCTATITSCHIFRNSGPRYKTREGEAQKCERKN